MHKAQIISLNILLFIGSAILLYFVPIFNLVSFATFLIGLTWLYTFHNRPEFLNQKINRFSFFWFMGKVFKLADTINNSFVREVAIILLPYSVIVSLSYLLKAQSPSWPFLLGIVVFEICYFAVKLVKPDSRSKKE